VKIGDAVQEKHQGKKIGIVVNVSYSKLYGWNHVIVLWCNGRKEMLPEYHVLGLSCE